jgi:hypothetical protein
MSIYYKIKAYLEKDFKLREEVSFEDDNGNITITYWNEESLGKAKPTLEQLNALSSQATALENNAKIDAKRKTEYLPFEDQLEMIYKDQKNGTSTYKDHCDKVRSDNPKD